MLDHISISQINTYLGCPLKYKMQYIEGRPFPFRPSYFAFGISVHSALEWFHKKEIEGKKVEHDLVCRIFEADWYSQQFDKIRYKSKENADKLREMGRLMIQTYLKYRLPAKVESVEQSFSVPLIDIENHETLEIPLVGRFDKIESGPTIVDIKTAAKKMSQVDADSSIQLSAYAYAYWKNYNLTPKLRFDILTKADTPKFEKVYTHRTQRHFKVLFLQAKQVLLGIQNEVFFANPSWKCSDCEFRSCCWYWNGEIAKKSQRNEPVVKSKNQAPLVLGY